MGFEESERKRTNLLRPSLSTVSPSLQPYSLGQSKSQGQPPLRVRDRGLPLMGGTARSLCKGHGDSKRRRIGTILQLFYKSQTLSPPCTSPPTPILILLQANTSPDTHVHGLQDTRRTLHGHIVCDSKNQEGRGKGGGWKKSVVPSRRLCGGHWSHRVSGQRCRKVDTVAGVAPCSVCTFLYRRLSFITRQFNF